MKNKRILLTGAAGGIGSLLYVCCWQMVHDCA
jgi:FlaA1/EpsC-like NDP-sugar epimerase